MKTKPLNIIAVVAHPDDHEILWTQRLRIRGHARSHGEGFATLLQRQAICLHGCEMGAARHQRHFSFRPVRQSCADVAADCARAKDTDFCHARPSFCAKPMRCNFPVGPLGISLRV